MSTWGEPPVLPPSGPAPDGGPSYAGPSYAGTAVGTVPEPVGLPLAGLAPPPGHRSEDDIPMWVLLAVGGVVLALVAATMFFFVKPMLAGGDAGPTYPDTWDRRVIPFVKVVERERGLHFQHPVQVNFLSEKEFEQTVTTDDAELTDDERKEIEQTTGMLRAMGLLTGDVDLLDATNDASGGGTLAYYSFVDETITVRGTKIRPEVRQTLVHELTHVLQDQNFRVGDRFEELQKDESTAAAESMFRAVVEGDAERVAELYRESLSAKQRARLDRGRRQEGDRAGDRLDEVPTVLVTMMGAPYTLGTALVQAAAEEDGNDAVDDLLRTPPTHDIALLRPLQELARSTQAAELKPPQRPEGSDKVDSGELGALTWYLMLAERLPVREALSAADGWGGDAFVAYDEGGTTCLKAQYAGRTRTDSRVMESALQRWVDAAPDAKAGVKGSGRFVKFRSCDPGAGATVGADASADAVGLALTRTYLSLAMLRGGAPERVAACVADRATKAYTVRQLTDPRFGAEDAGVQARIKRMAAACR